MAWAKLDDAMPHHPKVMMAGPQAFALDVAAICYSNRFGCDGFIADEILPAVLPCLTSPKKWAVKLACAGRWVRDDDRGGWQIHDIDDYQPSAEDQEAERAAARERMRNLRAQRKKTRPDGPPDVRPNIDRTYGEQAAHVRDKFVTPSRPAVPNGTGEEEDARPADLLTAMLPARYRPALDAFAGHDRLTAALDTAVTAGWPPGRAVAAVLAGSLDTARSVGAVLVARAETLARQKPPATTPDVPCPDCNGAGIRWSDEGTTAWPCGHPNARSTA